MKRRLLLLLVICLIALSSCVGNDVKVEKSKVEQAIDLFLENHLDDYFKVSNEDDLYVVAGLRALKSVNYSLNLDSYDTKNIATMFDPNSHYPTLQYLMGYHLGELFETPQERSKTFFEKEQGLDLIFEKPLYTMLGMNRFQDLESKKLMSRVEDVTLTTTDAGLAMMSLSNIEEASLSFIDAVLSKYKASLGWYEKEGDTYPSSYAQAHLIMGVTSLGQDANFYTIFDQTNRLVDNILHFQQTDGSFKDLNYKEEKNKDVTAACFAALTSYYVYLNTRQAYCIL